MSAPGQFTNPSAGLVLAINAAPTRCRPNCCWGWAPTSSCARFSITPQGYSETEEWRRPLDLMNPSPVSGAQCRKFNWLIRKSVWRN